MIMEMWLQAPAHCCIFCIFFVFSCLCVTPQLPEAPNEGGNVAPSSCSLCLLHPPAIWDENNGNGKKLLPSLGPSLLYIDSQSCRTQSKVPLLHSHNPLPGKSLKGAVEGGLQHISNYSLIEAVLVLSAC